MRALVVTIQIKPEHRDAFMEAMLDDARGSDRTSQDACGSTWSKTWKTPTASTCTKCTATRPPSRPTAVRPTI